MNTFKQYLAETLPLKTPTVYKSKGFSVILDAFENVFKHSGRPFVDVCLMQALLDCIHTQTPIVIDRGVIEKSFRSSKHGSKTDIGALVNYFAKGVTAKGGKKYSFKFSFYEIENINELKTQINSGVPVLVLIHWTYIFSDMFMRVERSKDGIIRYPKNERIFMNDFRKRTFHAITAVGYDENQKMIICKNQENFHGLKGYVKIDQRFFFNPWLQKVGADAIKKCMGVVIDEYEEIKK